MKYRQRSLPCHPVNLAADALALALAAGLPLVMPNGYIGLIGYKFDLLLYSTLATVAVLLFSWIFWRRGKAAVRRFAPAWLWPVGVCASYAVAWFFAQDRETAFWGLPGRKNGLLLLLLCTAVYGLIALFSSGGIVPLFYRVLVATGCVVTLLSWLNYWMIDPLDAYYAFLPEKGELFLGTVGNINFYGALLCLCVPLAAGAYLQGTGKKQPWRYAAALLLCSGLIPAGSDGAWLGCAVAVLALCCTQNTTTHVLARLCRLFAGLSACAMVTRLLCTVLPFRAELRTVSAGLGRPLTGGCLLLLSALGAWLLARKPSRHAAVAMRVVCIGLFVLCAAAFLAANLLSSVPEWLSFLHFDERWAANRGYAWQKLWVIYTEDMTPLQKLFGLGGDAVKARLNPDIESIRYMTLLNGDIFDSAHNEFLQHLVCGGAAGLFCWCGFLFTALRRGFRNVPSLGAALLGYAVQSFFSISMPGVFPLVFVLAALAGPAPSPPATGNTARVVAAGGLLCVAGVLMMLFS